MEVDLKTWRVIKLEGCIVQFELTIQTYSNFDTLVGFLNYKKINNNKNAY